MNQRYKIQMKFIFKKLKLYIRTIQVVEQKLLQFQQLTLNRNKTYKRDKTYISSDTQLKSHSMSSSFSHLPPNLAYTSYSNNPNITAINSNKRNSEFINPNHVQNQLKSSRPNPNQSYGQINNQLYTQTTKPTSSPNSSFKLTQMSSDLAKLKQQLSKIMNQADKLEKSKLNTSQYQQNTSQYQQNTSQYQQHNSNNTSISKPSQNQTITQSKNLDFNMKDTYSTMNSQRKQIAYHNASNSINQQEKPYFSIDKPRDFSMNYLPDYEKKNSKIESHQSQKNLNFISNNYFTGNRKQTSNLLSSPQNNQKKQSNKLSYENVVQQAKSKLRIKDQFQTFKPFESLKPVQSPKTDETKPIAQMKFSIKQNQDFEIRIETNQKSKFEESNSIPSYEPAFHKKSSSSISHEMIVNKIVNEELNKKIESNIETQQLRKKKQQEELQYQQKIIELQHEKRKMKHDLSNALLQKENLQTQVKNEKSQKQSILKKYTELQQSHRIIKIQLEEYKNKAKLLQRKLQNEITRPKTAITETVTFDESLKQQLVEIKKYKDKLEQKDEEILRLKDLSTTHRREIDSLHNQMKIEQLKAASQLNQCDLKNSILLQDKQNQIKTFKNLITTLEAKLEVAVKQNRSKDAFMVQHLTGKAKSEDEKKYIELFFKNYECEFPTNRISEKIREQQQQIERLKKTILQMAAVKK